MNRKYKISAYALIILAGSLVALISLSTQTVAAADISSLFNPPLTKEEKDIYQKIGKDKREIERFIDMRLFMRTVASFVAQLPKGVDYKPSTHGCPLPPFESGDFKYPDYYFKKYNSDYLVTYEEQTLFLTLIASCIGKNGRTSPVSVYCGTPVDRESVLSQLTPPVSQEELRLFDKANQCAASEIPKFLATRKYMRQINKLVAGVPAGGKFDPLKAPLPPEHFDGASYRVSTDPSFNVIDIYIAHLQKAISDKAK